MSLITGRNDRHHPGPVWFHCRPLGGRLDIVLPTGKPLFHGCRCCWKTEAVVAVFSRSRNFKLFCDVQNYPSRSVESHRLQGDTFWFQRCSVMRDRLFDRPRGLKLLSAAASYPNQSICQSINQTLNQPINCPINKSFNQSVSQPSNQLVNQKINQSINHPISQSINQTFNQPINQPF